MKKHTAQNILNYHVIFEEQPEGGYTVTVPALPGCITEGDTFEEAKEMAADAIKLYVQCLIEDGEEVPVDTNPVIFTDIKVDMQGGTGLSA